MIKVPFPHMALNADDLPGEHFEMWNTGRVPKSKSAYQIADWIATVARGAPGGKLETVIFNCHGKPGRLLIGQGITRYNVHEFYILRSLVERIWIVACKVAKVKKAGTVSDGYYFCRRLARKSGAFVIASTIDQTQIVSGSYRNSMCTPIDNIPYGYIDDWEHPIFCWNPKGEIVSYSFAYYAIRK
jgi:hypothetical protein